MLNTTPQTAGRYLDNVFLGGAEACLTMPCRFSVGNVFQFSDENPGFKNVRTVFENCIPLPLSEEIAPLFCHHEELVEHVLAQPIP